MNRRQAVIDRAVRGEPWAQPALDVGRTTVELLITMSGRPLTRTVHNTLLTNHRRISLTDANDVTLTTITGRSFSTIVLSRSLLNVSARRLVRSLHGTHTSIGVLLLASAPLDGAVNRNDH